MGGTSNATSSRARTGNGSRQDGNKASTPSTGNATRSRAAAHTGHAQAAPPAHDGAGAGTDQATAHARTAARPAHRQPATPPDRGSGSRPAMLRQRHQIRGQQRHQIKGNGSHWRRSHRLHASGSAHGQGPSLGGGTNNGHQLTGKDWRRLTPGRQQGQHTDNRQRHHVEGNGPSSRPAAKGVAGKPSSAQFQPSTQKASPQSRSITASN